MSSLAVDRTIHVAHDLWVTLRVPLTTALQWVPEWRNNRRVLAAAADGRANHDVRIALHARGVSEGRWIATFDGDRVALEREGAAT
jgi:hypothetical protein